MSDPNISNPLIENVTSTIKRRLADDPIDTSLTDAELSKKSIEEQNRELRHKEYLSKGMFMLLTLGYYITATVLILSGFQYNGFYLEPYVLVVLIGSSMGTTAYMSRRVMDMILGS